MGLDFCKPCGNGFQAERDPGLTGGDCPCTTANCGTCGERCCDVFCQVCVGVCCGLCSGDCSYTFCHLCLGVTQDLVKVISATTPPSDKEGYAKSKKAWLKIPQADAQEVIDAQAKVVRHL
ncbi:unnamed protein product [Arctogadus glacialis]